MSLREARQIYNAAARHGRKVSIKHDRPACVLHNPKLHRMAGGWTVIECYYDGGGEAARWLWSMRDVA